MIDNLRELNDKVNSFVDFVVKTACEKTFSGQYYVSVDDACKVSGMSFEDFLSYKDLIVGELHQREELLDFDFNEHDNEFDLNCALNYCPNYEWTEGDESIFGSYEEYENRVIMPVKTVTDTKVADDGLDEALLSVPENDFCVGNWRVHIVPPGGETFGVVNHTRQSFVDFFDLRAEKTLFPMGKFVERRSLDDLFDRTAFSGVDLSLFSDYRLDRDVSTSEATEIFNWLGKRELLPGEHYFEFSGEIDVPTLKMNHCFGLNSYEPKRAGELLIGVAMNYIPFFNNILIENVGEYRYGQGYSVSFDCKASSFIANKVFKWALKDFNYKFDVVEKTVPVDKPSLDSVISNCEKMSKKSDVIDINKHREER